MRKIIVLEMITLDGVIQAPGGYEEENCYCQLQANWKNQDRY